MIRATVVDNYDPLGKGRVRIRTEELDNVPVDKLPWAEYCSPFGGGDNVDGAGFFFVPSVGTQVWVMYEGGDKTAPVYIGSSFYGRGGRQNPPMEAVPRSVEPKLRIIKSSTGHRLAFDDRPVNEIGGPPIGVVLETNQGTGLQLQEPTGNGRGIRLGFGTGAGELRITRGGAKLLSNAKAGIVINDQANTVQLRDSSASTFFQLMSGKVVSRAKSGLLIESPVMVFDDTDQKTSGRPTRGYFFRSTTGGFEVKTGGNHKFVSGNDISVQTGRNFNVQSNQFQFTGQVGSNFTVDLRIPGIPGTNQGNITVNTAGGTVMIRNGLPATTYSPTSNDQFMGSFSGRLFIGDQTSGNAGLEGRLGGIFISGKPVLLPSTAGGSGGRPPIPLGPISPTIGPGGPQPLVLGGNLYNMLSQLFTAWQAFISQWIATAPTVSTGAMGPNALNPALVTALTNFNTTLVALQNTFFPPSAGTPTAILSSYTFTDG